MKKTLILLAFAGLYTSCIVQGLTNDYNKLSEANKLKIVKLESFQDLNRDFIYKISGQQLREELKNHTKSIVYIFTNDCSSELCKPLAFYEDYASKNGYKIFFVMTGYGSLDETLKQAFTSTLFAIDNEYYNKKFSLAYLRYFENDLLKKPLNEKRGYEGNLYFFEGDKLVNILKELPKE